ncbi:putative Ig domain-containing protein [Flavobacterium sp. UBA7680]|uniref:putative Ig domain-containing protein n=1 Tax=Flavobacterium sp. UBA7680 TaxID=1946559 RepID=UPI0025C2ECD4|nr:putative Ig domain-containing protein [Flavobacterium sp. UBA7680]
MKNHKFSKIILFIFLLLTFISCEHAVDCIKERKPNLISKELKTGSVFVMYNDNVTYEMLNTRTDEYRIDSASIEGNLPPGLNYSINNHNVTLSGIPKKNGTYEFTVSITVTPLNDNDETDSLCESSTSKKYKITIQ